MKLGRAFGFPPKILPWPPTHQTLRLVRPSGRILKLSSSSTKVLLHGYNATPQSESLDDVHNNNNFSLSSVSSALSASVSFQDKIKKPTAGHSFIYQ